MTAGRCSAPVCHLFCLVWAFLSETPEVFTPSSQDFVRHRGWAARSAAGGCRQAAGDEEPFTRSSDPNLAYLSAGTKVYNLCHGLNEAWARQRLSSSPRARGGKGKSSRSFCSWVGQLEIETPCPMLAREVLISSGHLPVLAGCLLPT